MAIACARLADKKKSSDIVILNIQKYRFAIDYFVICSARNKKQAQAIVDELTKRGKKSSDFSVLGVEGYKTSSWVLLDLGDVVVHVFLESVRKFYDLEFLWSEASRVRWNHKK
ncbi:MAG: ribosome silencing factor [Planctomycetes bacterium]|nr:ribosome silencing factor [Planctomycetota bacterium]